MRAKDLKRGEPFYDSTRSEIWIADGPLDEQPGILGCYPYSLEEKAQALRWSLSMEAEVIPVKVVNPLWTKD